LLYSATPPILMISLPSGSADWVLTIPLNPPELIVFAQNAVDTSDTVAIAVKRN